MRIRIENYRKYGKVAKTFFVERKISYKKKSATAILQGFEVRREKMRREVFQFRVTCRSVGSRRLSYNYLKKFKDYETIQCLDTIKKFLEVIFNINTVKQNYLS
jgi:aminopeptidase C